MDVDNTLVVGKPELRVRILRDRAAELGADVAEGLRLLVGGVKASTYAERCIIAIANSSGVWQFQNPELARVFPSIFGR